MNYEFDGGNYVRRFRKYNVVQMMELKDLLDLQMAPSELSRCASYFGSTEKRDPTVEELKILDRISTLSMGNENLHLTELYTNDTFCADTYADMMNKRRELCADTETPISVGEAMNLATAYLGRIGKRTSPDGHTITLNHSSALTERAIGIAGASVSLSVDDAEVGEGDVFLLIHRGNLPFWKYDSLIDPLLSSREVCESAKAVLTVPEEGLLPLLLRRFEGVCYHLRALAPSVHAETIEHLIGKYSGYRVLLTSKTDAERVAALARRMGFSPILFAAVTKNARTTFLYTGRQAVSYQTDFLRTMTEKQPAIAKLPIETKDVCGEISHTPVGFHSCRYLDLPSRERIHLKDRFSASSARSKLNVSPYRTALQTALTAILSGVVAGGSVEDGKIAISLRAPSAERDESRVGQLLSAILGIYRLQCELAIHAAATELLTDDAISDPELCVFSVSPTETLPSEFVQSGSTLYCVSPVTDENGLPNFDALRQMIRELKEFCNRGIIKSARVLCNERITDAVEAMETDKFSFHLTDGAALTGAEIPMAIILESAEKLPYSVIGYVTARENVTSESTSVKVPAFEETINRGDSYEILILSGETDMDAVNLARILQSKGANCVTLFDTTPNGVIARAMMGAQLVILCGDYTPDISEQISFACRVLREAGGRILRLKRTANLPDEIADFSLSEGLSSDLLAQIALQCERLKSFS